MASFQVKRRDTGIIYSVKVAEFFIRDNYTKNENGMVTLIKPNGYTEITALGDNIIDKLGKDALMSGAEFYFTNNPSYYLKAKKQLSRDYKLYYDSSAKSVDGAPIPEFNLSMSIYYIGIYKDNIQIANFLEFWDVTTDRTDNVEIDPYSVPSLTASCHYKPRFAFSFNQNLIAAVSPYYFNYPEYKWEDTKITITPIQRRLYWVNPSYIGKPFYLRNCPKTGGNGDYGLQYSNKEGDFLFPDATRYYEISKAQVIDTLSQNLPIGNYTTNVFNSYNFQFIGLPSSIEGMQPYDFYYSLLFDTIPENDPYPDNNGNDDDNPSGQTPPTNGGNPSGGNNNSDDIPTPPLPSITPVSTGSVNLYKMSENTFRQFMSYLWSNPFYTTIIKLFSDPMQCIITTHLIGVNVPSQRSGDIIIGNCNTNITANIVDNNFISISFGSITISEYYGDSNDYETIIELYLPYYGSVILNTQEIMNATLTLTYNIDVLNGTFVAFLHVSKNVDGTILNSVLYQYNGNMAYQIPLSSADYSQLFTTAISLIGSTALTGIPEGNIPKMEYNRSGNLGANTGYMGIKNAYVTILRPIHSLPPNFANFVGYPYEGYVSLGSCSGFTKCRQIFINNVIGSEEETAEIKRLLENGVIF